MWWSVWTRNLCMEQKHEDIRSSWSFRNVNMAKMKTVIRTQHKANLVGRNIKQTKMAEEDRCNKHVREEMDWSKTEKYNPLKDYQQRNNGLRKQKEPIYRSYSTWIWWKNSAEGGSLNPEQWHYWMYEYQNRIEVQTFSLSCMFASVSEQSYYPRTQRSRRSEQ